MKLDMKIHIKIIWVIISMLMLSSCLSPVKVESESTYVLNRAPTSLVYKRRHPVILLIMQPETNPVFATTQMAYTLRPYQVAYFVKNRWAKTPSEMLMPLIIQTMQRTRYFRAVVTPPYFGRYDYVLNTQILELQQDFTHHPSRVQFKLRAQMVRAISGQVISTKEFTASIPMRFPMPYSGVIAANYATEEVLYRLARFCIENSI